MRNYELILVLQSDLDETVRGQIIERVLNWLPLSEGEPKISYWGRRPLAYTIEKQNDGYYVLIEAALDPKGIAELERNIFYVEEVLRHLVVRKES